METQKEISRPAQRDMSSGLLFSNFPPVELSNADTRENTVERLGEQVDARAQGRHGSGEQQGTYGQPIASEQFGTHIGQPRFSGQFGTNIGQQGFGGQL